MIDREAILGYARANSLDPFWVENDYLQHIVLECVFGSISSELSLKGGTALQKVYGLNRLSRDLDFNLSDSGLVNHFEKGIDAVNDFYDTSYQTPEKVRHGLGYTINIRGPSFGPLNAPHIMKATVNLQEKLALKPAFKSINPSTIYKDPDLHTYSMLAMDMEEIFAEKVRALLTRKSVEPRDLYDLKFMIDYGAKVNPLLIRDKLAFDHSKFSIKSFRARVREVKLHWEKDLSGIIRELPSYDEAATRVLDAVVQKME
ncbi:MAG: nucleotidyl transferase AbiEii/AbiGii toxin family protein [Candidatus Micrarchaeota archaeon]|nr:nucleotidyl transferase AbiEii/AbiGii toxin family protein [Candidatus Micrarchaeota archaeon]MDE1848085.1 nucleotidyl transferase AbiEii/AbiGii toxin family protein [Candidatus Micrarchaeota archaeon]MDE1864938.1 nucleotidyl transferase AbiEii/AbiGii toxin family protein [Candidatus Micrarchaeota archaeon]